METPARQICVRVDGQDDQTGYLNCLNAELAQWVDGQAGKQAALQAIEDRATPGSPNATGLVDHTATRERLGAAFGHSPIPDRPTLIYQNPLTQPHGK